MIKTDKILIVGQGLAGSILAFELWKNQIPFEIWDDPKSFFTSSKAAGGIFNPITGRKLEKTWLAKEIFSYLPQFYQDLEILLHEKFYFPSKMFRPFGNDQSKNWLFDKKKSIDSDYLVWDKEGVWIQESGWVDVPRLLKAAKDFFVREGIYQNKNFDHQWIRDTGASAFQIDGKYFSRIIFAEGFHAQFNNPFFKHLCFLPAKGELLQVSIPDYKQNYILSKNGFIYPFDEGKFRVGATYRWDEFSSLPTGHALVELKDKLAAFSIKNYTILSQETGVRPATQDRRPFIGFIPQSNLGIFNGFGSKGVSLIPYFAKEFLKEWNGDKIIPEEASIRRFYH